MNSANIPPNVGSRADSSAGRAKQIAWMCCSSFPGFGQAGIGCARFPPTYNRCHRHHPTPDIPLDAKRAHAKLPTACPAPYRSQSGPTTASTPRRRSWIGWLREPEDTTAAMDHPDRDGCPHHCGRWNCHLDRPGTGRNKDSHSVRRCGRGDITADGNVHLDQPGRNVRWCQWYHRLFPRLRKPSYARSITWDSLAGPPRGKNRSHSRRNRVTAGPWSGRDPVFRPHAAPGGFHTPGSMDLWTPFARVHS